MNIEKLKRRADRLNSFAHVDEKKVRHNWPIELLDRVDDAIVANLQTEIIARLTGRPLHRQTPQALMLMLSSLEDV